ncbi:MAG: sulfatase-like hydrolase/transferase [Planctomycetes bacterium]|nr:sulfatase-like hydrolase/transferase [Planctomycetota bacterium]
MSIIETTLLGLLVALVLTISPPNSCLAQENSRRPNVVLIVSDDQTYTDFGFMGNAEVRTPNLDQLAAQSARYVNGYVPSSVCRPSLVTLLTGLYPHQHGVHFNHPPPGFSKLTKSPEIGKREFDKLRERATDLIKRVPTLPRLLSSNGYRCFQTGKYWEGHWHNAGFTEGMTTAEPSGGKYGDKRLANGDVVAHGNGDHGLVIGRETMQPIDEFIDDCGAAPFLVWYAPFLPHTPHNSPKKYFDLYESSGVPKHRIPYYAAITQFDDTVGHLVQSLEKRGLARNTVFLFVVDNGWEPDPSRYMASRSEWDHTKRSKRAPFDYGLRTPILVRWDGQTKPSTHKELVSSIDVVPTLLSACGLEDADIELPGIDLMPSACGAGKLDVERTIFGEIYPGDATKLGRPASDVAYRWVRQGDLKLITTHDHGKRPAWNNYLVGDSLFDVVADPSETHNVIDRVENNTHVASLRRQLDEWWQPGE